MTEKEKKPVTAEELEEQIARRAQSDKDFKKALVDNPKDTLGQLGIQFPEEVEVKVVEESGKLRYLMLPLNSDELTDEQLADVGGGFVGLWTEVDMAIMWSTSSKTSEGVKNKDEDAKPKKKEKERKGFFFKRK